MHFVYRNVNTAFYGLIEGIQHSIIPTIRTDSRNGPVLQIPEPVIITYEKPKERVLLNKARDANPFFHLYESMWMLAGRNDVAPLAYYASNMKNYSDDGRTLNGAYGYRWRHAAIPSNTNLDDKFAANQEVDQLSLLINHLKEKPDSRRAVLSMWNVEDDLLKIGSVGWGEASKDTCCNLSVCFSIREEESSSIKVGERLQEEVKKDRFLNMTVFNRSNDLIWGCLGANVVHFSFLQEYVANCLGVEVGVYNQVSNNLHVYESNWKPEEWLEEQEHGNCYPGTWKGKLVEMDQQKFDLGVKAFSEHYSCTDWIDTLEGQFNYKEPWLHNVAVPMCKAFYWHKKRDYEKALITMDMVQAPDWRRAGTEWIERRRARWLGKNPYLASAKRHGDLKS